MSCYFHDSLRSSEIKPLSPNRLTERQSCRQQYTSHRSQVKARVNQRLIHERERERPLLTSSAAKWTSYKPDTETVQTVISGSMEFRWASTTNCLLLRLHVCLSVCVLPWLVTSFRGQPRCEQETQQHGHQIANGASLARRVFFRFVSPPPKGGQSLLEAVA